MSSPVAPDCNNGDDVPPITVPSGSFPTGTTTGEDSSPSPNPRGEISDPEPRPMDNDEDTNSEGMNSTRKDEETCPVVQGDSTPQSNSLEDQPLVVSDDIPVMELNSGNSFLAGDNDRNSSTFLPATVDSQSPLEHREVEKPWGRVVNSMVYGAAVVGLFVIFKSLR